MKYRNMLFIVFMNSTYVHIYLTRFIDANIFFAKQPRSNRKAHSKLPNKVNKIKSP